MRFNLHTLWLKRLQLLLLASLPVVTAMVPTAQAESIYQSPGDFIAQVYDGNPPPPQLLWITAELRAAAADILQHDPGGLRMRYWQKGARSAWILDEIGKDKPITTGVVVNNDRIESIRVLVFRESRGWEVKHPFFTDQFIGAGADKDKGLDRRIDGITGATLSVQALKRQAQLALLFARYANAGITDKDEPL